MSKWMNVLAGPRAMWALVLLGVLLNVPSLGAGLIFDDYLQWALLTGYLKQQAYPASLQGLFNLASGQPEVVQSMKDSGRLLWVAPETLRMTFWRPLAELTHWLDYQLWPGSPWLMHAQSVLWFGALLAALGSFYKRIMPGRLEANMSLAIYALSSLHVMAVAWLSARNQLLSTCFTVLTIMYFHDWRTGGKPLHGVLALVMLLCGLASAEATVAAAGYLVAYSLTMEQGRAWRGRALSLLPFLLMIVVWRVACTHAGYGSEGSGSYVDPVRQPVRFAEVMTVRLPVLLGAQLLGMPTNHSTTMTLGMQWRYALMACAGVGFMAWILVRSGLSRLPVIRFLGLGALFAVVPVCAVAPQSRVLIHSEIGTCGLLALLLIAVTQGLLPNGRQPGRIERWTAGWVAFVHLLAFPLITLGTNVWAAPMTNLVTSDMALFLPRADARPDVDVVLINPPVPNLVFYAPLVRAEQGLPTPRSMRTLAVSQRQPMVITVLDTQTIRVSSTLPFEDPLHRDNIGFPFKVGDVVRLKGTTITIDKINADGSPMEVRFKFDGGLSDPRWRFYIWRTDGYALFQMPQPGGAVTVPSVAYGELLKQAARAFKARQAQPPPG